MSSLVEDDPPEGVDPEAVVEPDDPDPSMIIADAVMVINSTVRFTFYLLSCKDRVILIWFQASWWWSWRWYSFLGRQSRKKEDFKRVNLSLLLWGYKILMLLKKMLLFRSFKFFLKLLLVLITTDFQLRCRRTSGSSLPHVESLMQQLQVYHDNRDTQYLAKYTHSTADSSSVCSLQSCSPDSYARQHQTSKAPPASRMVSLTLSLRREGWRRDSQWLQPRAIIRK